MESQLKQHAPHISRGIFDNQNVDVDNERYKLQLKKNIRRIAVISMIYVIVLVLF